MTETTQETTTTDTPPAITDEQVKAYLSSLGLTDDQVAAIDAVINQDEEENVDVESVPTPPDTSTDDPDEHVTTHGATIRYDGTNTSVEEPDGTTRHVEGDYFTDAVAFATLFDL